MQDIPTYRFKYGKLKFAKQQLKALPITRWNTIPYMYVQQRYTFQEQERFSQYDDGGEVLS